ncbi:hypothetical protein I4U23_027236 [Adineta vaga]|nr:hypothetical protein I4U23_027236 [Adineta vaga]
MGAKLCKKNKKNSETFLLIWLDATVNNSKENINAQQQLRKIVNCMKIFTDEIQFDQYIRTVVEDDEIILIISGHFGYRIVPRIHQFRQILSIYVYCNDKIQNEQWSKEFIKVKKVIVQLNELLNEIQSEYEKWIYNQRNKSLAICIFNTLSNVHEQSTIDLNGQFLYSQLLMECLIRMESTIINKNELISLCKLQYKGNKIEMKNINEFQQDYIADQAIKWYTRPSFLYQILNRALRTQNIDLLFYFRFFICDIEQQLKQHQCSSFVRLYRGQLISINEFKSLQNSINKFISINSFFSTTLNRDVALFFLGDPDDTNKNYQRILFEIDADPNIEGIKPFANITLLSYYPDEEEVLLMIGSIFRLIHMDYYEDKKIWIIQMKLCSDNDYDLKSMMNYMKNDIFNVNETGIGQFGNILQSMGKYDDAEKYYHRLLKEQSYDHQTIASCYWGLGIVAFNKGQFNQSLSCHKYSLKIYQEILPSNHRYLADNRNCIGSVYKSKGQWKKALKFYQETLIIYQQILGENHSDIAMCFANIGNIYQEQKRYSQALEYHQKAFLIWKNSLPSGHHYFGCTHNNIANIYYLLDDYNLALQHYNESLKIKSRSLPQQHPSIASTMKNIGDTYENMSQWQLALTYFKQAANIYCQTLPSNHPYIIGIQNDIRRISSRCK